MLWCAATLRSSHAAAAWLWAANLPAASSTAPLPPCAAHPTHTPYVQAHALKNRNASRTTRLRRVSNASRRRIMMTGGWVGGFLGVPGMQGSCAAAAGQAGMHACSRGGHKSLTPPPPPLVARRPPVAPPAGTPLQNDLAELQNLLHFLLPSVFAAQGFEDLAEMLQVGWAGGGGRGRRCCNLAFAVAGQQQARLHRHTVGSPRLADASPVLCVRRRQGDDGEIAKLTERMKSLLGPFVLRRLKTEVAGQLTSKSHVTGGWALGGRGWAGSGVGSAAGQGRKSGHVCGSPRRRPCTPPRPLHLPLLPAFCIPHPPHTRALCSFCPTEFIEMTEEQAALYSASLARMRSQLTGKVRWQCCRRRRCSRCSCSCWLRCPAGVFRLCSLGATHPPQPLSCSAGRGGGGGPQQQGRGALPSHPGCQEDQPHVHTPPQDCTASAAGGLAAVAAPAAAAAAAWRATLLRCRRWWTACPVNPPVAIPPTPPPPHPTPPHPTPPPFLQVRSQYTDEQVAVIARMAFDKCVGAVLLPGAADGAAAVLSWRCFCCSQGVQSRSAAVVARAHLEGSAPRCRCPPPPPPACLQVAVWRRGHGEARSGGAAGLLRLLAARLLLQRRPRLCHLPPRPVAHDGQYQVPVPGKAAEKGGRAGAVHACT